MPNFRQRKWLFVAIAIAVIILLTLVAAPNSSGRKNDSGSTYGRNPDGYGAWYEYMMSQRDVPIARWRKPFSKLIEDDIQGITYLQIRSKADFLTSIDVSSLPREWIAQGNTLVIIGSYQPATAAPFTSFIPYRQQPLSDDRIKIQTTRRYRQRVQGKTETILGDRYGAVVWQEKIGKGKVIYCTTPYLAANAYRDHPENYQFLAELVSDNEAIWVDEYIHGYRDRETIAREQLNVLSYLVETPLFLLFIQAVIIAGVASIVALRRFGQPVTSRQAIADNSTAYIDALAGVLEKANSTDFALEVIGKDEQRKLQTALGLGRSLVDRETLLTAWKRSHSSTQKQLPPINNGRKKLSDAQLISWVRQWQKINDSTNSETKLSSDS